jgi:transposase-like protein
VATRTSGSAVRVGETDRPKRRHRAPARPIHFNLRLEEGRLCCLVLVGVRADGTKELVAVADGQRESADAWAELLRDLRRRGMGAPVVMVGDGALVSDYGAKWPKAVAKVVDDAQALLCFFDYPAEHWGHLRTTNPIASTFSPVRARTRVTKGPGNKDAGLAMVCKLLEAAEGRWRAVNGPHLVALVRAGARFEQGRLVERPAEPAREMAA